MPPDLETDDAILKLVSFVGACLSAQMGTDAASVQRRALRYYEWLSEWLDDSAGE